METSEPIRAQIVRGSLGEDADGLVCVLPFPSSSASISALAPAFTALPRAMAGKHANGKFACEVYGAELYAKKPTADGDTRSSLRCQIRKRARTALS